MCCLLETAQKAPRSVNGSAAKFASGGRISPIFEHCYGYVRTVADQIELEILQGAQVVIFTSTTTRAVHLELITDKTSEAFLMAFR